MTKFELLELFPLHFDSKLKDSIDRASRPGLVFGGANVSRQEAMADIDMPSFVGLDALSIQLRRFRRA